MKQRRSRSVPIDSNFPVELADRLSQGELYNRHHYRPNTYLHKWWARRCGSTFRLILKQLVDDPEFRDFYAPGGLDGKLILDPFMGGGTTLHEAIRLGANVFGGDLDPLPVLQARATLTHIPLASLEEAFAQVLGQLAALLVPHFLTRSPAGDQVPLRYMLYGLERTCSCGPVLLVDSFNVRLESGGRRWHIDPVTHDIWCDDRLAVPASPDVARQPLALKHTGICPDCHERYREQMALPFYQRYRPVVAVGEAPDQGAFFRPVDRADLLSIAIADQLRGELTWPGAEGENRFQILSGPKSSDLHARHVADYRELFTSRQLLYLHAARRALQPLAPDVRLNLALLVSTSLEFNSLLCGYKGANKRRPGAVRHVFSRHAFAFPYTAVENNPVFPAGRRRSSGTLPKLFHDRIRRARRWAAAPRERVTDGEDSRFVTIAGEQDWGVEVGRADELQTGTRRFMLHSGSSASLPLPDAGVDFVVTDPPYFDSVQYGDLGRFFHAWLPHLLGQGTAAPYALEDAAVDPRGNGSDSYRYAEILADVFRECRRVLRPQSGRLIFTFHHWKPAGWAALTLALRSAGFVLCSRYIVRSENPSSVHIAGLRSLVHDAILVLAPRDTAPERSWSVPDTADRGSSYQYCRDCASFLGKLLAETGALDLVAASWERFAGQTK